MTLHDRIEQDLLSVIKREGSVSMGEDGRERGVFVRERMGGRGEWEGGERIGEECSGVKGEGKGGREGHYD